MLKNVLLAIGSVMAALIVFELLLGASPDLRADNASPKFVFCRGDRERYQQHAVFRKAEIPGSVYFEHNGEGWSIHLNNERGFRDIFDSGDRHAIILGDSFTRGTSVNDHQTIPYLLDLWDADVAFHSFATGGSGTADALRAYQAIGKDWEHRLVILNYFPGNDLRNNLASDTAVKEDADEVELDYPNLLACAPACPPGAYPGAYLGGLNPPVCRGVRVLPPPFPPPARRGPLAGRKAHFAECEFSRWRWLAGT